jgi:polysaccharide chain length determinant protein (PEP-CTERM system associated)
MWLGYCRVLLHHRWTLLLGTTALFLVLTMIIAHLPNVYEATTTILVDPQQVPERYVAAAVNSDPGARLNIITQQLLSRTRLQSIIDRFGLYKDAHGKSNEELIAAMRNDIKIQVRQGSGPQLSTFTITFQGPEPQLVERVTNELATSSIEWNEDSRERQVEGTKAFVSSELESAKKSLEEQENSLRQFKMSHLGETPDQALIHLQAIATLQSTVQANAEAMNRMQQEKMLLARLPQSAAATPNAPLTARGRLELEKHQIETRLEDLLEHYSAAYPDVAKAKRRLSEVNAQLSALPPDGAAIERDGNTEAATTRIRIELIDKELNRLQTEQNRTHAQIAVHQAKIDAAPVREQQLVELTRNYEVSKQHYQSLLDKSFNIEMAVSLEQKQKAERFTVLDPARAPEKPVKPGRRLLLFLAALASVAVPITCVLGFEIASPAVKTEADVAGLLPAGCQVVALVPHIGTALERTRQRAFAMASALGASSIFACTLWVLWRMRTLL